MDLMADPPAPATDWLRATLAAARKWAIEKRADPDDAPPPDAEPTLWETLQSEAPLAGLGGAFRAWQARSAPELATIPPSGSPDQYEEGSPERALAELVELWARGDFDGMARLVHQPLAGPPKTRETARIARDLRTLEKAELVSWEILELSDRSAATTTARVGVQLRKGDETTGREADLQLLYLDARGEVAIRGTGGGSWVVMNFWELGAV